MNGFKSKIDLGFQLGTLVLNVKRKLRKNLDQSKKSVSREGGSEDSKILELTEIDSIRTNKIA